MRFRTLACRFLGCAGGVFAAFLACGLITRPVALLLPGLYAFHAVLMALPASFALTRCLRKGASPLACAAGVCLFAAVLGLMSPIMGASAFAPLVLGLLVWAMARKAGASMRACTTGFTYGAAYYPCTMMLSAAFGSLAFGLDGVGAAKVAISIVLGASLAGLGTILASGTKQSTEGE